MTDMMQRIVIVGSGGSGKSMLARQIGAVLGLDVVHLDRLLWKPGWVRLPPQEQEAVSADTVSGSRWIVEGDHLRTQPLRFAAADTIIFLDFTRRVWRYPMDNRAQVVANIVRYGGRCRVVTLCSPKEVRRFIDDLPNLKA